MKIAVVFLIIIILAGGFFCFLNCQDVNQENSDTSSIIQEKDEEIRQLKSQLEASEAALEEEKAKTDDLEWQLELASLRAKERLDIQRSIIEDLQLEIAIWQSRSEDLESQLLACDDSNLRRPSFSELKEFLEKDKTDEIRLSSEYFSSFESALELMRNAEEVGIYSQLVVLAYHGGRYDFINAFSTTDQGMIYIWSPTDAIVTIEQGESFRGQNGYELMFEDTIKRVVFAS